MLRVQLCLSSSLVLLSSQWGPRRQRLGRGLKFSPSVFRIKQSIRSTSEVLSFVATWSNFRRALPKLSNGTEQTSSFCSFSPLINCFYVWQSVWKMPVNCAGVLTRFSIDSRARREGTGPGHLLHPVNPRQRKGRPPVRLPVPPL